MAEDFAENHDVAADHRDRLIAMIGTWYVEAGQVRRAARRRQRADPDDRREAAARGAARPYVYYPGTQSVPYFAAPKVLNRPHSITAEVEIPDDGAEGVLLCQGSAAGGYTLFVQDGKLHYVHNYVAREYFGVSTDPDPGRERTLRFEFEPTGELDLLTARGARAGCSSTSTASSSASRRPSRPRRYSTPVPSPAARTPDRRSSPTTRGRSGSPGRSTRSPSTSAAS